jgi:hypothetical protein
MLAVERYADAQSQLSFRDLDCARWTVRLAAAGGAPRCDVNLVAARVSCGSHVRRGTWLPCSIHDVSAVAFGNFGELRVDAFELFVDNAPILKRELDLLLRFGTQSVISRCSSRVILCDFYEALNLVLGGAAPTAVLVSFVMPWGDCRKPFCDRLDAAINLSWEDKRPVFNQLRGVRSIKTHQ